MYKIIFGQFCFKNRESSIIYTKLIIFERKIYFIQIVLYIQYHYYSHYVNPKQANLLQKHVTPTLEHLIDFSLRSNESLNIVEKIAKEVDDLGIFLLSYEMTDTIKTRFNNDLVKTTKEVLHQWIQGKGKHPVTWNTFIQVLRKIGLSVVANEIEDSLN